MIVAAHEKAKAFLNNHASMSSGSGEALEIIRALLEENAAWQRSHGRKATAGARLAAEHQAAVKTLQDSLSAYEQALRAIAENGMDAGQCRDFAVSVLARIENKEEAEKP